MQSRVIVSGEPLLFNDVPERTASVKGVYYNVDAEGHVEKIPDTGPAKTTAALMVPVKDEGRVVGVVQLMTDSGAYWTKIWSLRRSRRANGSCGAERAAPRGAAATRGR